uniref:Uncharacterized protein n=1 Tax=Aegilops tauschii TaxID=37682 RepID=R7WBD2_AEGTA
MKQGSPFLLSKATSQVEEMNLAAAEPSNSLRKSLHLGVHGPGGAPGRGRGGAPGLEVEAPRPGRSRRRWGRLDGWT